MRQDSFTYRPQFKLLIVGNHKPVLRNVDEAARRRFNIIPFVHKPETPDQRLEEKLKAEYPAILRARLRRIEAELGLSAEEAEEFRAVMAHIRREARRIHAEQIAAGIHDG